MRTLLFASLVAVASPALAQQPSRPPDSLRSVTLSLAEYNRLLDLAARPPAPSAVAPVGAVVSSADLKVRIEGSTARGVFSMSGEALRPGVSRVPLVTGATFVDVTTAGGAVPLVTEGKAHAALVSGPGPFSLTLDWGAPLSFAPGRASFVLPVPQAGTVRATIEIPGEQADVRFSAGLITRRAVGNGRTVVDVTLDPGSSTEVSWSMRDSAPVASAREARTIADVMTVITIDDSDVRLTTLVDLTVVQGEPRTVSLGLPAGYELTGITGSSLERSEVQGDALVVTLADPTARSHQLLVGLERPHRGGSLQLDTGFISVRDVQRERGEVAIEGAGTIELAAAERDGIHRMDVREMSRTLQTLVRLPVLAAFRYQRTTAMPALALDVKRFADVGVLAAVADKATATTLVTSEGRALTEVALEVQNRAQPFLKLSLPAGATMVSAEVAGQPAKPVAGADGIRVPLLRPGFRPTGTYRISFVYLHAGTPFARKGDLRMTLPKMDIPIGLVEWELFVPEQYSARAVDGNVISATRTLTNAETMSGDYRRAGVGAGRGGGIAGGRVGGVPDGIPADGRILVSLTSEGLRGELRGRVTDGAGRVLPGTAVTITSSRASPRTLFTGPDGTFVASGVPAGDVSISARLAGFRTESTSFVFDEQPRRVDITLALAALQETITVHAESPAGSPPASAPARVDRVPQPPSQSVVNLQRRTAGVLPVRVDVPRAGTSHQFVKPLLVDQEMFLTLRYKRK